MSRKRNWKIFQTVVRRVDEYYAVDGQSAAETARAAVVSVLRAQHGRVVGMEIRSFVRTVKAGGAQIAIVVGVARLDQNRFTGLGRA